MKDNPNALGWADTPVKEAESMYRRASRIMDKTRDEYRQSHDINRKYKNFSEMTPEESYALLGGEAEARATQARMNMDEKQRLATYPAESYDRPIQNLLVVERPRSSNEVNSTPTNPFYQDPFGNPFAETIR
jgi:hypothetical protein